VNINSGVLYLTLGLILSGCGPARKLPEWNFGLEEIISEDQPIHTSDVAPQESLLPPEIEEIAESAADHPLTDLQIREQELRELLPAVFQYQLDEKELASRRLVYRPNCIIDPARWPQQELARIKQGKTYVSELVYFFNWHLVTAELAGPERLETGKSIVTISKLKQLRLGRKTTVTVLEPFRRPLKLELGLCKD
jgi:hypothetical protein